MQVVFSLKFEKNQESLNLISRYYLKYVELPTIYLNIPWLNIIEWWFQQNQQNAAIKVHYMLISRC